MELVENSMLSPVPKIKYPIVDIYDRRAELGEDCPYRERCECKLDRSGLFCWHIPVCPKGLW